MATAIESNKNMRKEISILIVEDDITFSTILERFLTKRGFRVQTASNCAKARELFDTERHDIVLCDLRLPDDEGITLLPHIEKRSPGTPLIIMTNYANIESAVNAMKQGASDYISKPVRPDELLQKIEEALNKGEDKKQTPSKAEKQQTGSDNTKYIEGSSDAARQLYSYVSLVAPTPMSVLINGASGTGKEFVAHRIHRLSRRADKPFIAIDCGAIPKELAASEFFGHVKGSFTGAHDDKRGAFIEANGGTLFLDEIGNLSYEVQVQLLRALQERRIRPIGSTKEIEVDIRLVSATNEDLHAAIERGSFREDLYHRINEFTLVIPSLRERGNDIMIFANHFLDSANNELGRHIAGFDDSARTAIINYSWPGNLRQLKNTVKRATLLAQGEYITAAELALPAATNDNRAANGTAAPITLDGKESEKRRIIEALQQTSNNKSRAAQLLGIDRKTLYNKLKIYGIE